MHIKKAYSSFYSQKQNQNCKKRKNIIKFNSIHQLKQSHIALSYKYKVLKRDAMINCTENKMNDFLNMHACIQA